MSSTATASRVLTLTAAALLLGLAAGCAPVPVAVANDEPISATDAFAARRLAQKNNCLRCHSVATRQKKGPTYAEVAAKYRAQPDAEARLYQHLTSGMASLAKVACSDFAVRNAGLAIELMGADGLRHEHGVEKRLRDAKLLQIYEGTNQLNRINYFKCLLRPHDGVRVFLRNCAV